MLEKPIIQQLTILFANTICIVPCRYCMYLRLRIYTWRFRASLLRVVFLHIYPSCISYLVLNNYLFWDCRGIFKKVFTKLFSHSVDQFAVKFTRIEVFETADHQCKNAQDVSKESRSKRSKDAASPSTAA